jgi:radical SAM superfamily enzyme YgiQ (UPF0313 family)
MGGTNKVDLVLVNPGGRKRTFQSLGDTLSAIEPPVWAGLIATFLRRKGHSVAILDVNAENLSAEEAARRVEEIQPRLIAVVVYGHQPSASTQNMPAAGAICTEIKKCWPESRVILVGGHVAALPERTLREENVDFVAAGEGLYTILDLLQCFKSNQPEKFTEARGLHYLDGEKIVKTSSAPLLRDLDGEMPMIAWDLLPMDKYRAHNWHCFGQLDRQPYASIYTTLGCPYHCTFCCIQAPFKDGEKALGYKETVNSYRFWSPKVVIEQIDLLVNEYGVRHIKFADEIFVLTPHHVLGICDLITERGYDLNIWAYGRVDTVRDQMIDRLKQAGFNWLAFGVEAGNDRVRDNVRKGVDRDRVFQTIGKVQDAGINIIGNYIFGLPEDDMDSMQETLDLALDLNCEFANFYCSMAYPGSSLYDMAVRERWPLPKAWTGYSQHSEDTFPLPTKYLSPGDVLRFRDRAFHIYFSSPKYSDMIERKFGPETVQHIRDMNSHTLKRKYA